MSEVTTGSVAISIVGAPIAVGSACVLAAGYAAKYCNDKYQDMLNDIQKTDDRLKWLNHQQCSSPEQIAKEVKQLQHMLLQNKIFAEMTTGLTVPQKNVMSTVIATENSPLKSHLPKYIEEMELGITNLDETLFKSTNDLATCNFNYLNNVLQEAAHATGFKSETKIIRQSNKLLDIVFTDIKGRRFTAYNRLNKDLNPSLALDLEGFGCDSNECTLKMDEIIAYLNEKGIPFEYKRLTHNQPEGMLRKMLNKKRMKNNDDNNNKIDEYLKQSSNKPSLQNKTNK